MSDKYEAKEESPDQIIESELNEIEQIDSIEYFISTLSPEEIDNKISIYKQITKLQLNQMSQFLEDVDAKVFKATQAPKQNFIKSSVLSSSSSVRKLDDVNQRRKDYQLKNKKLEEDSDDKLKLALEALEDEHNREMNMLLESHNEKVKQLSLITDRNQVILNDLNDSNKYISIQSHNKALNDIGAKYKNDIDALDKEIKQLENAIKGSYSQWVNKQNNSIVIPNVDKVHSRTLPLKIKEFIGKLKNRNGNDNVINLVSQMQLEAGNSMDDDNVVIENNKDDSDKDKDDKDKDDKDKDDKDKDDKDTLTINQDDNSDKLDEFDVQEFNRTEEDNFSRHVPLMCLKLKREIEIKQIKK